MSLSISSCCHQAFSLAKAVVSNRPLSIAAATVSSCIASNLGGITLGGVTWAAIFLFSETVRTNEVATSVRKANLYLMKSNINLREDLGNSLEQQSELLDKCGALSEGLSKASLPPVIVQAYPVVESQPVASAPESEEPGAFSPAAMPVVVETQAETSSSSASSSEEPGAAPSRIVLRPDPNSRSVSRKKDLLLMHRPKKVEVCQKDDPWDSVKSPEEASLDKLLKTFPDREFAPERVGMKYRNLRVQVSE